MNFDNDTLDFSMDIIVDEEDLDVTQDLSQMEPVPPGAGPGAGPGAFIDQALPRMHDDHPAPKPSNNLPEICTTSLEFGGTLQQLIDRVLENHKYPDLQQFLLQATAHEFKDVLDTVSNPVELAQALHRLRCIIGIAEYDPKTFYDFYYIFSYSTHEGLTDDTENFIAKTMVEIVSELFLSPFYLLDCDISIDIIALPRDLTEFEEDWIKSHQIWGLRTQKGVLEFLQDYLTTPRISGLSLQEYDWKVMHTWMKEAAPSFPDLDKGFTPTSSSTIAETLAGAKRSAFEAGFQTLQEDLEDAFLSKFQARFDSESEQF